MCMSEMSRTKVKTKSMINVDSFEYSTGLVSSLIIFELVTFLPLPNAIVEVAPLSTT